MWQYPSKSTQICVRMSTVGVCGAAVTAKTKCGEVMFMECGELLYGKISSKSEGAVYMSYVRPAILDGSEA